MTANHEPTCPLLYTLKEAASLLKHDERTIRRMKDDKEIRAVRIRHRWMIPHDALREYIDNQPTNNA